MTTCFSTGERHVLALLQDLDEARAALELLRVTCVEVARELREGRHLAVLREVELAACRRPLFIALICALPPTRLTEMPTLMAGRTPEKKRSRLEEDLPVGDRDDVGRDVRRDVAGLRLDDRERGERAARVRVLRRSRSSAPVGCLERLLGVVLAGSRRCGPCRRRRGLRRQARRCPSSRRTNASAILAARSRRREWM